MQDLSAADGGAPMTSAAQEAAKEGELNLPDTRTETKRTETRTPMDTLPPFPQPRAPEPPRPKRKLKLPLWLVAGAMFLVGLVIGIAVMRQRTQSKQIIVSVNGATITRDDLFNHMQDSYGAQTVHTLAQNLLQVQFAAKKGLAPTQAQVDAEYAKLSSRPNFAQALAQSGMLPGDFKENLRVQLAETNVITQGVTATEADAQAYYKAQSNPANPTAQFYRPAEVSLRAIATQTEPQAQRALAELASGTPFELAASTYSADTSRTNGGLLAPLSLGRSPLHQIPALEQRVFALKIGDQIGPAFFSGKWWIFRCQDKAAAVTVPYSQVQDQCLTGAKLAKGTALNSRRIQQEFLDFQHTSNLQAFWPQYQRVIANH